MSITPLRLPDALRIAERALPLAGYIPEEPTSISHGAVNFVLTYSAQAVALRVSPLGLAHVVRRGYHLATQIKDGLSPEFVTVVDSHVVAFFPLAEPQSSSQSTPWVKAQLIGSRLHALDNLSLHLPPVDPLNDTPQRISYLSTGPLESWVRPLDISRQRLAAQLLRVSAPLVPLHGDLHAAQVVTVEDRFLLTDFDHAALGPKEADWARIYAFFTAGELPGEALSEAIDQVPYTPSFGLMSLYAKCYVLRYVSFLARLYLDDPTNTPNHRLAPFARTLGLDTSMLPEPYPPVSL